MTQRCVMRPLQMQAKSLLAHSVMILCNCSGNFQGTEIASDRRTVHRNARVSADVHPRSDNFPAAFCRRSAHGLCTRTAARFTFNTIATSSLHATSQTRSLLFQHTMSPCRQCLSVHDSNTSPTTLTAFADVFWVKTPGSLTGGHRRFVRNQLVLPPPSLVAIHRRNQFL